MPDQNTQCCEKCQMKDNKPYTGICCHLCPCHTPAEWEKGLDELVLGKFTDKGGVNVYISREEGNGYLVDMDKLKSFIRNLLSAHTARLLEEVEKVDIFWEGESQYEVLVRREDIKSLISKQANTNEPLTE